MTQKEIKFQVDEAATLLPFVLARVTGKSRNNVKSMLARGQIAVDGAVSTRFDHPLAPGQTVTVSTVARPVVKLPFAILYEDSDLIVIDKPAGLLSIATDQEKNATAYRMVTGYVRAAGTAERLFVVHRLDRDTSGVLLFAKNESTKLAYQDKWDTLVQKRSYTAVVEGVPEERNGTVRSWLRETKSHLVYSGAGKDGKEAVTHYQVAAEKGHYSLVTVQIDTGRKNQIRVHMRDLGCPVAGDKKYGAKTDPFHRLALHAGELVVRRPGSRQELRFVAHVPGMFRNFFRQ